MCGSDVSMIRFRKEKNGKIMKKKEVCFLPSLLPPTYLPTYPTYLPTYLPQVPYVPQVPTSTYMYL